jgi:hypothetical protein
VLLHRYFAFLEECAEPKACTILLRGGSKDFLNEVERNLQDAMQVARNVVFEPKLLPGGGATEMALSVGMSTHPSSTQLIVLVVVVVVVVGPDHDCMHSVLYIHRFPAPATPRFHVFVFANFSICCPVLCYDRRLVFLYHSHRVVFVSCVSNV